MLHLQRYGGLPLERGVSAALGSFRNMWTSPQPETLATALPLSEA